MDIDALLAAAKLPEETVPLCLRPDLRRRFEELDGELLLAKTERTTMAPTDREHQLAAEIKELEAEIAEHSLQVRMRGLKHGPWVELMAAHPPRADNAADANMGVNVESFVPALIRAEMVEPEMSDAQFEKLLDVITDRQYNELANAAWMLGREYRDAPVFSRAASLVIPDSGETSRQPSDSGSRPAGSRAKKPKS
ncbi:hypothetical protein [Amycolatopsis echigonensis]|uniref:Tail assembly chaperone n=1 Tax=Amycolatopsis echigonensis TaxID=2576905 RepID=A0A8E1W5L2_9PSEU|nr:hypothetical protein [Amycolatopsis echigonensis]MBB2504322.1 hypothetical protein [Amycolatopsis echigonensis]